MSDLEVRLRETLHRHAGLGPSDAAASPGLVAAVRRRRYTVSTLLVAGTVAVVLSILLGSRLLIPEATEHVEPATTPHSAPPLVYVGPDSGFWSRDAAGRTSTWISGAWLRGLCGVNYASGPRSACEPSAMEWSPDGRTLAALMGPVCCENTTVSLVVTSHRGEHARRLFACPEGSGCADGSPKTVAWSRDSERIVLTTNREMYVVPLQGGSPDLVCTCAAQDASFLPDGRVSYVASGRLLAWDPASGETTTLAEIPRLSGAEWSPDGRWAVLSTDEGVLSLMDMTASPPVPVAPQHVEGYSPRWSPDGTRFVYNRQTGHNQETFRSDLWVGAPRQQSRLLHRFAHDGSGSPVWSPDGRKIAQWIVEGAWPGTIYVVDAHSGKVLGRIRDAMPPFAWQRSPGADR